MYPGNIIFTTADRVNADFFSTVDTNTSGEFDDGEKNPNDRRGGMPS